MVVPNKPVHFSRSELSSERLVASCRTPKAKRATSTKTMVECPSENQNPTDIGFLPSATNFRVVLSIAAM